MLSRGTGVLAEMEPAVMGNNSVSGGEKKKWSDTKMATHRQYSGNRDTCGQGTNKEFRERDSIEIEWKKRGLVLELKNFRLASNDSIEHFFSRVASVKNGQKEQQYALISVYINTTMDQVLRLDLKFGD